MAIPPALLLDRAVKETPPPKLAESGPVKVDERLPQAKPGAGSAGGKTARLLQTGRARAMEGAKLFTKNCGVCHGMDGQGGNVGPQLDGIGARGLERLCEDVLDPNRNVDRAFRTTLLSVKDGDVVSGLFRREEGEMVVLADPTGKEISVPRKQITERRESESSLIVSMLVTH
jgi:putative heme-binding domain-containing protein